MFTIVYGKHINNHLFSIFYGLGIVFSSLNTLFYLILQKTPVSYYPHFIDGVTVSDRLNNMTNIT